jgi:tRNA modification GTPase
VAIVRLSGPRAQEIVEALFRPRGQAPAWESHRLYYGELGRPGEPAVDEVLAVVMRAPRSYTRETVAEIHCHGGLLVAGEILEMCLEQGARLASPGEFTLRAFLNGRLDLAQSEAVLALVRARTRAGLRLAAAGLAGRFSRQVAELREALLDWMAELEAAIDFAEEVPDPPAQENRRRVEQHLARVEELLAGAEEGRLVSEGLYTVLAGPPNAGKSTLLNALLGEERALVTPEPGTTRDWLEESLVVEGLVLRLVDTAGLRPHGDVVEQMGMARARAAAGRAEVAVVVLDVSADWPEAAQELAELCRAVPAVVVLNKKDLGVRLGVDEVAARFPGAEVVLVSLLEPEGVARVRQALVRRARQVAGARAGECYTLTRRQREALYRCRESLQAVRDSVTAGLPAEFLSGDLRLAVQALGEITGQDVTEDLLDRIFSSFCLGK